MVCTYNTTMSIYTVMLKCSCWSSKHLLLSCIINLICTPWEPQATRRYRLLKKKTQAVGSKGLQCSILEDCKAHYLEGVLARNLLGYFSTESIPKSVLWWKHRPCLWVPRDHSGQKQTLVLRRKYKYPYPLPTMDSKCPFLKAVKGTSKRGASSSKYALGQGFQSKSHFFRLPVWMHTLWMCFLQPSQKGCTVVSWKPLPYIMFPECSTFRDYPFCDQWVFMFNFGIFSDKGYKLYINLFFANIDMHYFVFCSWVSFM